MTALSPSTTLTALTPVTQVTHPYSVLFKHIPLAIFLIAICALSTRATAQNDSNKRPPSAKKTVQQATRPAIKQPVPTGPAYATRDDAMQVADDIAARRNLDREWVRQAIGQSHYLPQIARFITPPAVGTVKNWRVYRSRFIDPVRINAGVKFWQANREVLERAEKEYGVPAEIIVGIIGVETIYGQQVGTFRVMDALTTLSFNFPSAHPRARERREFFLGELEQFLSLCSRTGVDPLATRGSFAGAMGMPQFMPSSWVKYAVDFDGDGKVDLFSSPADVIGSVANYFKAFNWQPGMATHYPVTFDPDKFSPTNKEALLAPDILPTFSVASFTAKGAVLEGSAFQHTGPLALVELQNAGAEPTYIAGTENFYAITRYNWSSYYALAVIELGREVARVVNK
jgi:membrane-bound lytic murein transglycosylase B